MAALIELAKRLRLHVVAEGVETELQYDFLQTTGCDEIQGYFFSKPLSVPDFEGWMERQLRLCEVSAHSRAG